MADLDRTIRYNIEVSGQEAQDRLLKSETEVGIQARYGATALSELNEKLQQQARYGTGVASALQQMAAAGEKAAATYAKLNFVDKGRIENDKYDTQVRIGNIAKAAQEYEKATTERVRGSSRAAAAEKKDDVEVFANRQRLRALDRAEQVKASVTGGAGGGINLGKTFSGAAQLSGYGGLGFGLNNLAGGIGMGAAAGVIGIGAAAVGGYNLVKGASDQARELQNLANEFGITAQQAFKLDAAAKLVGEDFSGSVSRAARKLAEAIEEPGGAGKKTAEALTKMGVDLHQGLGSALHEVMENLAKTAEAGGDATQAIAIFGAQGAKIQEIAGHVKDVHQELKDNLQKSLLDANVAIKDLGNSFTIWEGQAAGAILTVGRGFQTMMSELNLAGPIFSVLTGTAPKPGTPFKPTTGPAGPKPDIGNALALLQGGIHGEGGKLTFEDRLKEARDKADAAIGTLKNTTGIVQQGKWVDQDRVNAETKAVRETTKAYEDLEAQKKKVKAVKIDPYPEALRRYQEESATRDLGPVGSAMRRRDDFISKFGSRAGALQAGISGYNEELGFGTDGSLRQGRGILGHYGEQAQRSLESEMKKNERELGAAGWLPGTLDKSQDAAERLTLRNGLRDKNAIGDYRQLLGMNLDAQEGGLQNGYDRSHIGKGDLSAGNAYSDQMSLEKKLYDIREQRANLEEDGDKAQLERIKNYYQYVEGAQNAELQREQTIAAEQDKNKEATGSFLSGLFNSAIDHNTGGFLKSQGRGILSTIVGNVGKNAGFTLNSLGTLQRDGNTPGIMGTQDAPNFLGKILSGTPFGFDKGAGGDAKFSTDRNSTVTEANTAATTTLTGTLNSIVSGTGGSTASGNYPTISSGSTGGFSGSLGSLGATPPFLGTSLSDIGTMAGNGFSGGSAMSSFGMGGIGDGLPGMAPGPRLSLPGISSGGPGTSGSGGVLTQLMTGVGSVLKGGGGLNSVLFGGTQGTDGAWTSSTSMERLGSAAGLAGAAATGVMGALSGFSKGGARGVTSGLGSILGSAASIDQEPISKTILGIGAGITALVSSLFGDPRQERQKQEQKRVTDAAYVQPASIAYTLGGNGTSGNGSGISFGEGGSVRSGNFATMAPTINIQAMDAKNVVDFAKSNPVEWGQAMLHGFAGGSGGAIMNELNLRNGNSNWSG